MSEESTALWYSSGDGLSLFSRGYDGPSRRAPVLCLHDAAQTSRVFRPIARELSATRRIVLPDLRGHGRSDYTIDRLADDAARLLDVEEIRLAAVIGWGVGGVIALQLAARQPERISAIILVESGPELARQEMQRQAQRALQAATLESWEAAEEALPGAHLVLRDAGGRPSCDWDPLAPAALIDSISEAQAWTLFDLLKSKPMLAIRGAHSQAIDAQGFNAMAWRKPDLVRDIVEARQETRLFDAPQTIEAMRAFLATCP